MEAPQDEFGNVRPDPTITVPEVPEQANWRTLSPGQLRLMALVVALAAMSVLYRWLVSHHLEQTSLLFIGIPMVLAIILAAAPKAKSLAGGVMRGMTFALLFSGLVLGEGFICVLMAAPLFYLVALFVVGCMQWYRNRTRKATLSCVALLLIPVLSEGLLPELTLRRDERVEVSEVVSGTPAEVRARLAAPLRMSQAVPMYLRLRFPRPVASSGQGLEVGDERVVTLARSEGEPGDLRVRVGASEAQAVRFDLVSDTSRVSRWLSWQSADIRWNAVDAGHTRVTCTLSYTRRLDPAWYFGPWEWYAVRKTAGYLIAANAGAPRADQAGANAW